VRHCLRILSLCTLRSGDSVRFVWRCMFYSAFWSGQSGQTWAGQWHGSSIELRPGLHLDLLGVET